MRSTVHVLLASALLATAPMLAAGAQEASGGAAGDRAPLTGEYRLATLAGVPLPAPIPGAGRQAQPARPCLGRITDARVIGGVLRFGGDGSVAYSDTVEVDCRRPLVGPHTYTSPRLTLAGTYAAAGTEARVRLGGVDARVSTSNDGTLTLRAGEGAGEWMSTWRRADAPAVAPPVAEASRPAETSRNGGAVPGAGVIAPTVRRTADGPELLLPAALSEALRTWNPEFAPLRAAHYVEYMRPGPESESVPWAAAADFDGDGRDDVALMGRTRSRAYLVAVLGGPAAARVVVLEDEPLNPEGSEYGAVDEYLTVVRPGRRGGCGDGPVVATRWPAIGSQVEGKGGTSVYYWTGEKFTAVYEGC